jgi:hypothetical protein
MFDVILLCRQPVGSAIAQAAAGFEPRSGHVAFVVDKVALGEVFCEFSSRSTLIIIYHPGLVQRPINDRRIKYTHSHPHPQKNK